VEAWIGAELERAGFALAGEMEQPHVRPWSTVLRVPTTEGDLWFKANIPLLAFEAGVVQTLAARRADLVPMLLAADLERGWMLQGDGGTRLREIVERTGDFRVWERILPLYAELQMDVAADEGTLLRLGVPDRRLAALPAQFDEVLGDDEALGTLTGEERRRLETLAPRVGADAAELAAYGIPETIQHDDLHDGQIFVQGDRFLFFDWGDSCVSHPFFTMVVTLAVLAWRLDVPHEDPALEAFRDAYLEGWTRFATRAELGRAYPVSYRLGVLCRGLTWRMVVGALPRPLRDDESDVVPERMRMLLEVYGA